MLLLPPPLPVELEDEELIFSNPDPVRNRHRAALLMTYYGDDITITTPMIKIILIRCDDVMSCSFCTYFCITTCSVYVQWTDVTVVTTTATSYYFVDSKWKCREHELEYRISNMQICRNSFYYYNSDRQITVATTATIK
jgi:hypothetical protein